MHIQPLHEHQELNLIMEESVPLNPKKHEETKWRLQPPFGYNHHAVQSNLVNMTLVYTTSLIL